MVSVMNKLTLQLKKNQPNKQKKKNKASSIKQISNASWVIQICWICFEALWKKNDT